MIQLDTIYNMDCLEGMKMIDNDSIDCVITDLPYGVLNRNNKHAQWDSVINLDKFWESLICIVKPTTPIILFCQGMFTARLMMSQPDMWRYNLVWDKCRATGFLNSRRMPLRYHEDIAVFYRNQPVYNPQMEDLNGREVNHPQGGGYPQGY